jgi:hypothetical protein
LYNILCQNILLNIPDCASDSETLKIKEQLKEANRGKTAYRPL